MIKWWTSAGTICLAMLVGLTAAGWCGEDGGTSPGALKTRVMVLTDPALSGRASGTPEAEAAAETLAAWMNELGLEPAFEGSWFQEVPLSGQGFAGEDLEGKTGRNVAGLLRGRGPRADRFVVVGAHYDHLGRVDPAAGCAPPPAAGEFYPGANDNASGVAVVMELAALAVQDRHRADCGRGLLFAFFVAEEVGLQGSGYMVSHLPVVADSVDAMINFDTVGQLTGDRLYVSGVGTAAAFAALVDSAGHGGLELSVAQGGWSGSDHMSFNTREIPVLFVFGGAYPQYNRPTDDWPSLDYEAMSRVTAYSNRLLHLVRTEPGDLPWIMVDEKNLRQDESDASNRDTWFGSLPDFTEDVTGYKLAGVFDDSPAARAGFQKGDVLVMFGGTVVTDLPTFTRALRSHAPGDLVEVRVIRQGRSLNFTVDLGSRADRK